MSALTFRRNFRFLFLLLPTLVAMSLLAATTLASPPPTDQLSFRTPDEAVKRLVDALRNKNRQEITAIFGPGSGQIVSSGDPVADRAAREKFLNLYDEKNAIEMAGSDKAILSVGDQDFPFPIPITRKGGQWRFDTGAGKEELLNRRIGRNELEAINTLHAYVDAQHEYATKPRSSGVLEFAQKIRSTPGKEDGLYWKTQEGEEESPLGPLAAQAAREGYTRSKGRKPTPFHGYFFRILKAQGKYADGGAFNYLVNGRMVLGFAMVAYPAQYGSSGIMTFIVNQNGIVYQKDLGKNTGKIGASMKAYNPDKSWKKVK